MSRRTVIALIVAPLVAGAVYAAWLMWQLSNASLVNPPGVWAQFFPGFMVRAPFELFILLPLLYFLRRIGNDSRGLLIIFGIVIWYVVCVATLSFGSPDWSERVATSIMFLVPGVPLVVVFGFLARWRDASTMSTGTLSGSWNHACTAKQSMVCVSKNGSVPDEQRCMKQPWRMLVAASFCAILASCDLDAPKLASASVSIYQADQPLRSWQLSRAQVASLDAWLVQHRSGWNPDPATYRPRVMITGIGVDGSTWGVNVLGTVVVVAEGRTQLKQSFERAEIDSLDTAIGVSQ